MPPEGAPAILHDLIAQGRAAVLEQLAQAVGPGLESPDPELIAHVLSAISDEGARLLLTDPERYPVERIITLRRLADAGDRALSGLDAARLERIRTHFDRYVDDGRLPGYLVQITRDGELAYEAAGGQRDLEAGLPVEPDTLWRIYSMTKPITSVAAMMLWEEGAFELKDPIARWLPEFAEPRVFTGGAMAKVVTAPAAEPIRDVAPADPHLGADLRLPSPRRGRRAVPRRGLRVGLAAGPRPRRLLRRVGRAAAAVPARHGVELRALDRRPRARDRGHLRPAARRVPRRPRARPAGDGGDRLPRPRGRPRPPRRALRPGSGDRPRQPQPRLRGGAAPARVPLRRRRAGLDRGRLRALHAHAARAAASSTACACSARARCG